MHSLQETLASWAAIVGTILSLIGLVQSRAWLTAISVVFVVASILTGVYARSKRLIVEGASVVVEGRSIDSLNIANLRRRLNKSLVLQEAHQVARIEGEDLEVTWQYGGYCRAARETAMEFSIDTDNNVPFADLECFAYDLRHDPGGKHRIRPMLIGADGTSKKIAVPFLEPVAAQQAFSVLLKCKLPGCMKAGLEYYTSTLSFDQTLVRRSTVRLVFSGHRPAWVRAYACNSSGRAELLRDMQPGRQDAKVTEFLDVEENLEGQCARIYVFARHYDQKSACSAQACTDIAA
jgi:hypothetical protein